MAKTLLRTVQDILSAMDSDEVNSISDTIESEQVAMCVETVYTQMVSEYDLPAKTKIIRLGATDDYTNGKTRLFLDDDDLTLSYLEYDCRAAASDPPNYKRITILSNDDFLDRVKNLDSSDSNKEEQTWPNSTFKFAVYNDRAPSYGTLIEESVVLLDAYDSDLDSSSLNSKTLAEGQNDDYFKRIDDALIDLPKELYNSLLANAMELAMNLYKGEAPMKVQDLARNGRVRQQRAKHKLRNQRFTGPNYGRGAAKGGSVSDDDGTDSGTSTPLPDYLKN